MLYRTPKKLSYGQKIGLTAVLSLVLSVCLFFLIRSYIVFPFIVRSQDMEPSLAPKDFIYVWRFFDKKELQRCSIVFAAHPHIENYTFIRRIIGLPRERIFIKERRVYINNEPLHSAKHSCEKKIQEYNKKIPIAQKESSHQDFLKPILLKKDEYFLLADKRIGTIDSRLLGPFPIEKIKGLIGNYIQ